MLGARLRAAAVSLAASALFAPAVTSTPAAVARADAPVLKFDFGPGPLKQGHARVLPSNVYTKESGYGFEPGAAVRCEDRGGDPARGDFCTADRPFYFSAAVPEGNYDVTVTFGAARP